MNVKQLDYKPGIDDPKRVILDALGDALDQFRQIDGSRVLIALAPSPNTLGKSGLIMATDKTKDEGRWQGKAGLILKLGTTAFRYDPRFPQFEWEGEKHAVGDWVHFFKSDTREIGIGGIVCCYIWDSEILGSISDPEACF